MEYAIDRPLDKQEIRRLLESREEGNVVEFYRTLRNPGNPPGRLAWLKKEPNSSQGVLKDVFAAYGGSYDGGSVDIDAAVEFVSDISPGSYAYTGPRADLTEPRD